MKLRVMTEVVLICRIVHYVHLLFFSLFISFNFFAASMVRWVFVLVDLMNYNVHADFYFFFPGLTFKANFIFTLYIPSKSAPFLI